MLRRRIAINVALGIALWLFVGIASAQLAVCRVAGPVYVNGQLSPNTRVTFTLDQTATQPSTQSVIRPSSAMRITDSGGNLPAINLPQGVTLKVIVGNGPPVQVKVPSSTSTTLSALLP